jgi:hypothetical protein
MGDFVEQTAFEPIGDRRYRELLCSRRPEQFE